MQLDHIQWETVSILLVQLITEASQLLTCIFHTHRCSSGWKTCSQNSLMTS